MGDMLPDKVPGEPRWLDAARMALTVLTLVALVFVAFSYFAWVLRQ
jgi:hypothetical protein